MYIVTFEIDGITVGFMREFGTGINVMYDAGASDFDDPALQSALSTAHRIAPYLTAFFGLRHDTFYGDLGRMLKSAQRRMQDDPALADQVLVAAEIVNRYDAMEFEIEDRLLCELATSFLEGWADVFVATQAANHAAPDRRQGAPVRAGYVYILRAETGYHKIGRTLDYEDRRRTFTVKLPFRIEYELVIASEDYAQLEADLHERYADKRVDGEWFELTSDDIARLRAEYEDTVVEAE